MKGNSIQLHVVESLAKCLITYSPPRKNTVQSWEKRSQTLSLKVCIRLRCQKIYHSSIVFPFSLFPFLHIFSLFPLLFCLCCSNSWCSAEDKSPEELSTLAPLLEKRHIAHIFFIRFQKYPCDGFCAWISACLAEQHPCLHPGQPHKDILPSAPAEASHRTRLLQKSIPCSEQLWTILVAVSKCLERSSGNVLLYNTVGPGMQQKASRDVRAWFKPQAAPPTVHSMEFRVPHLRIILLDTCS